MYYLGVDIGSVSTNFVLLTEGLKIAKSVYIRTKGNPIQAIQEGLGKIQEDILQGEILGVGTTGSGRNIASYLIGADIVKNEITAHGVAALHYDDSVGTIIEIGGQDSKIITLRNRVVTDFAMNTVCAAGTGSFIDRQAERLGIPIEEFGEYALHSSTPVRIAGRCAVFAESDMIHKQQLGYDVSDIIRGLCDALVRNYMNNVAKGKEIRPTIFFQGGVASNIGIQKAFERILECEVIIPPHHKVMGAIGAALLAEEKIKNQKTTAFRGFEIAHRKIKSKSFECTDCSNRCEVVELLEEEKVIGCFADRCGKWSKSTRTYDQVPIHR